MKLSPVAATLAVVLALPGTAAAQSAVTITGFFKLSAEELRLSQSPKSPGRETRIADDASRIVFSVAEDLGGGLSAVAQIDWRVTLDAGTDAASGNSWLGLRSRRWGEFTMGRRDLHYNNDPTEITSKAGSKKAGTVALLAYAGGGITAIAGNTRATNVVAWASPKWGAFDLHVAYSTNPFAVEADLGSSVRRGRAWNVVPRLSGSDWQLGWTHWNAKPDATLVGEQKADRVWGAYNWGAFRVGVAYDKSRITTGGSNTSRRSAWSLPLRYRSGNHTLHLDYARARDDTVTAIADGARMIALAYVYELSKRTSLGLSVARIRNDAGAVYNFDGSAGASGSPSGGVAAGEDPRILAATIRHSF